MGLLVAATILLGFLYWRLLTGPIGFDPSLSEPIHWVSPELAQLQFHAAKTELALDSDSNAIVIRFRDLILEDPAYSFRATVPELTLGFSWQPSVEIFPTLSALTARGARIAVIDSTSAGKSRSTPEKNTAWVRWLFQMPAGAAWLADSARSGAHLNHLDIVDLRITPILSGDKEWNIPEATITLARETDGLATTGSATIVHGGNMVPVSVQGLYSKTQKTLETTLRFDRTIPKNFLSGTLPAWLPREARGKVALRLQASANPGDGQERVAFALSTDLGNVSGAATIRAVDSAYAVRGTLQNLPTGPWRRLLAYAVPHAAPLIGAEKFADGTFEGVIGVQGDIRHMAVNLPGGPQVRTAPYSSRISFATGIDGTLQDATFEIRTPFGIAEGTAKSRTDGDFAFSGDLKHVQVERVLERFPAIADGTDFSLSATGTFAGVVGDRADSKDTFTLTLAGLGDETAATETKNESKETVSQQSASSQSDPVCGHPFEPELRGATNPVVKVTITASRQNGDSDLSINANAWNVPAGQLGRYWPRTFVPDAKDWVAVGLRAGIVEEAHLRATLVVPAHSGDNLSLSELEGRFCYRDLAVDYFPGMPPVTHARGTAVFDASSMHFDIKDARASDIRLMGGKISLTEMFDDESAAKISLTLQAPLRTALGILADPPLAAFNRDFAERPDLAGNATVDLNIRFPLTKDLTPRQMIYAGKAKISDEKPDSTSDGTPDGTARFHLAWDSRKGDPPDPAIEGGRNHYLMRGSVDSHFPRHFGFPDVGAISGEGKYEITFAYGGDAPPKTVTWIDLDGISAAIPELGWHKPARTPGALVFDFSSGSTSGSSDASLVHFSAQAGEFSSKGLLRFDSKFAPGRERAWRAVIEEFSLPGTHFMGDIGRDANGVWKIALKADPLDLETYLKLRSEDEDGAGSDLENTSITLDLEAKNIRIKPEEGLAALQIKGVREKGVDGRGAQWRRLEVDALRDKQNLLSIQLASGPEAGTAEIRSANLGALLKTLDHSRNMIGGVLAITSARKESSESWQGTFELKDYTLRTVPALARLLQLVSLTGPINLLFKEGLGFEILKGQFTYGQDRLALADATTYGESLGLTADGWIDFHDDTLSLTGTILPAYTINRLLGKLPIIGNLLAHEEGIIGFTYTAKGPLDDIDTRVNPLSVLVPGILKSLAKEARKEVQPVDELNPGSPSSSEIPPVDPNEK